MAGDYFELKARGTNVRTEIVAGVTTFLTMAYIIFVNPDLLSQTGMDKNALIIVTCLTSAIITIITGLFANAPIAMAPGMGLNTFFVLLVTSGKMNWQTALGAVFISGLFFLILTMLGLRRKLVAAIPNSLISAISVGIGVFIALVGLENLGILVRNEQSLFALGDMNKTVVIGLMGLAIMIVLEILKVRGSLLIGIAVATAAAAIFGNVKIPDKLMSVDWGISPIALKLDIVGALKWGLFGSIFSLMFIDMFDSIGTLVACCEKAGLKDNNNQIKGLDRLLSIDALATMIGALMGTSTTTSFVESAAGIEEGGKSGLTSVFTGALFFLALFFVPFIAMVPSYATAPAQIMVGIFMLKEIRKIRFSKIDEAIPAIIIMVMIAISYRISEGLAFGFISFVLIKSAIGKIREVKPAMWIIAALSLAFLAGDKLGELIKMIK